MYMQWYIDTCVYMCMCVCPSQTHAEDTVGGGQPILDGPWGD